MDRLIVEQARSDFDRKRLELQVRLDQRAVSFYTKHEEVFTKEGNDRMRVWAKKRRKKFQADLDYSKRKLEEYENEKSKNR